MAAIATKNYKRTIEMMLREYPYAKRALEAGLFPRLVPLYEEVSGGGSAQGSTTERSALLRVEKENLCRAVETALDVLLDNERKIIDFFYFTEDRFPVYRFCQDNFLSERTFYRMKAAALEKMARVLGLI